MNPPHAGRPALPRRLVLATAVLAGVVAMLALPSAPHSASVAAGPVALRTVVSNAHAQAPGRTEAAPIEAPAPATPATPEASAKEPSVSAEITIDERGVTVKKGTHSKKHDAAVVIDDHEFDSFEQFVEQAPWLAGLVFMVIALVFVVPLLVIVLVIWYKVRRTRMMNETMLKLAERGVVPPAEAMEAIASGRPGPALQNLPPTAPLYEQARALRKRAAWSDLRKGVLIGGVGLGLTFWSMLDDGSANGFGLILLFVGIGYTILWYLEERPGNATRDGAVPPPGGV